MAELMRLDSSRLYGSNNPGCVWGLFHIFDFYNRREMKKMISYKRLGVRQYDMGTDILVANETGEEDTVANKGTNNIVKDKDKTKDMTKGSSKVRILNFIGKKLLKGQKHKGKMSHSSSHSMHTISAHHFETNDHSTPSESSQMASDNEFESNALQLDEIESLTLSEHESLVINGLQGSVEGRPKAHVGAFITTGYDIDCTPQKLDELGNHLLNEHMILKEKLFEARDALLKHKDSDSKAMTEEFSLLSKIFLDTLHLFNTNREALYSACKGQKSFLTSDFPTLEFPAMTRPLNRSASLTGLEFSGNAAGIPIRSCTQIEFDDFINQGSASESAHSSGSHELRKQREAKTVLSRLRDLKRRLKSVIVENRQEQHRIYMDRILDKVPSGHKQLEQEDNKFHLRVGPVSRGGQGFTTNRTATGSSTGKFNHSRIQRSRSLTESLERYSQLLDSISANEVRKVPERSKSNREDSSLLLENLPKTHRRLPSNPEFLSSYSFTRYIQSEVYIACQSPKMPTVELHDSNLASTADGYDKLTKDSILQPAVEEIAYEQKGYFESTIVTPTPDESDIIVTPNTGASITYTKGHERLPGSINERLPIMPLQFSENLEEKDVLYSEQESHIEDEPNDKPESASPNSVLDFVTEEPVSPLKSTLMAGSDSQQLDEEFLEQLPCPKAQNFADINEINTAELSNLNFYEETSTATGDQANFPFFYIDEKDAARFNYVKHILSKSGYEALLCETEDSSIEAEITSHMLCAMPHEEQLMYDLINEVLFDIFEYSTAPNSWLSRFHSKIRSMPTGSRLLEEVWAEIRWHLSSPQGLDAMIDKILARNFTKTDDWMNLYRDAECFGLLLEQLILDDLVDEIMLDIDEF